MSRSDFAFGTRHRRELARRPRTTPTVDGDLVELGGECGLYVDMTPEDQAIAAGDWIATEAGSRYLVVKSRRIRRRRHSQQVRYGLQCRRIPKHAEPPIDVRVVWLTWYPRGRAS